MQDHQTRATNFRCNTRATAVAARDIYHARCLVEVRSRLHLCRLELDLRLEGATELFCFREF